MVSLTRTLGVNEGGVGSFQDFRFAKLRSCSINLGFQDSKVDGYARDISGL